MRTGYLATALAVFAAGWAASAQAADLQYGKDRYERFCAPCHNAGFWAANRIGARLGKDQALLENRTDLNAPYIEIVVQQGIGSMPPYRLTEVSPDELDAIADYLTRKER